MMQASHACCLLAGDWAGDLSHLRRLRKAISSEADDLIRFIYETGVQEVS